MGRYYVQHPRATRLGPSSSTSQADFDTREALARAAGRMTGQGKARSQLVEWAMRTIIAGSRTLNRYEYVLAAAARCGFPITELVSGTAPGIDRLGERWAAEHGIPARRFPANWALHGKVAGYLRNGEMADYAEALIAIWDGVSRGTAHMIAMARKRGLRIFIYEPLKDRKPCRVPMVGRPADNGMGPRSRIGRWSRHEKRIKRQRDHERARTLPRMRR